MVWYTVELPQLHKFAREHAETLSKILPNIRPEPQMHISLCKTFYARHWHIEALRTRLSQVLGKYFIENIAFDRWATYINEEGTRSFLALDCDQATQGVLGPMAIAVDKILSGFGFEPYYEVLLPTNGPLIYDALTNDVESAISCERLLGPWLGHNRCNTHKAHFERARSTHISR